MEFDKNRPIYLQILEDFENKISSGKWESGDKIDSVRNLSKEYEVNPNTVQRALQELERENLAESKKTAGRFVTENTKLIEKLSNKAFYENMDEFIEKSKALNVEKKTALKKLDDYWEDNND